MDRFVSPLVCLFASITAAAADVVARPQWQRHFDAKDARGTFVLLEPANDRYLVLNEGRARTRFLPASTFKIPNALIGLEVSAIEQVDFLRRLAEGELPMSQRSQRLVRNALAFEKTRDYTLYAKTGTSGAAKDPVDWWIGWVEKKGRPVAFFAVNLAPSKAT